MITTVSVGVCLTWAKPIPCESESQAPPHLTLILTKSKSSTGYTKQNLKKLFLQSWWQQLSNSCHVKTVHLTNMLAFVDKAIYKKTNSKIVNYYNQLFCHVVTGAYSYCNSWLYKLIASYLLQCFHSQMIAYCFVDYCKVHCIHVYKLML